MKRALAFALLMAGSPLDAGEIVQKPLDEFVIYNIPVACQSGNTTVLFPSAISGLYAKSVAVQEQPNADFVLSFTPGNFYFTVRALKKDAEDHLTVIFNRKAYVLHLSGFREAVLLGDVLPGRQHSRRRAARCSRAAAFASGQGESVSAFPEGPPGRAGWRPPRRAERHELLRQFQGDHPRRVAVRGGGHPRSSASTSKTRRTARSITSPRTSRSGSKTGFTRSPLPTRPA